MARLGVPPVTIGAPPPAALLLAAGEGGSVSWQGSRRWTAVGSVAAAFHLVGVRVGVGVRARVRVRV